MNYLDGVVDRIQKMGIIGPEGVPRLSDLVYVPIVVVLLFPITWISRFAFKIIFMNFAPKDDLSNKKRCRQFSDFGYQAVNHIILTILLVKFYQFDWFLKDEVMLKRIVVDGNYSFYMKFIMFLHTSRYTFLCIDVFLDLYLKKQKVDSEWIEMFLHHSMSLVAFLQSYFAYTFYTSLRNYPVVALSDTVLMIGRMLVILDWSIPARIFAPLILLSWTHRMIVLLYEEYLVLMAFGKVTMTLNLWILVLQSIVIGVILQSLWYLRLVRGGLKIILGKKKKKKKVKKEE